MKYDIFKHEKDKWFAVELHFNNVESILIGRMWKTKAEAVEYLKEVLEAIESDVRIFEAL